ncbi:AGAP002492-PA-like protein [Anopheles sinensis]|uniref:AGAP002492-PA-like protein n=1 Tax=Anopheles sinensis TaxID=74873 RepID=A0A084VAN3_ANOSI|nr:AGAP002492-PA-like protein [Anopheles sinensis]
MLFTHTVLQTIQNADGTVSIIQVDPNNPIITLPDGTTAQVQGIATLQQQADGGVHAIQTISDGQGESMSVDLTEATLGQDGQLIITGEDGQGFPVNVSGMITVPMSAQMYQTMVANIQQVPNVDGTVCITPMQVHSLASSQHHQQQQQQTNPSIVSTTCSTTQNLTISSNAIANSQQHQQAAQILANYALSANGATILSMPQLQQHIQSGGKQQRIASRSATSGLPIVGMNTVLPSQRGCFNLTSSLNQSIGIDNNNLTVTNNNNINQLNAIRKSNSLPSGTIIGGAGGVGSAGAIKICIPKTEPMDEDKDETGGTSDNSGTQSFVIQLSGLPFTDTKTSQHQQQEQQQQLKRDMELTVNEGSHLIDALSINHKPSSGSSNSSNESDQKQFAISSV